MVILNVHRISTSYRNITKLFIPYPSSKNDCQVNLSRLDIIKFAPHTVGVISQPQLETLFFGCLCLVKDGSSLGDHLKSKILIKDVSVGGSDHLLDYHVIQKPYPDSGIKQSSDLTLT